MPIQAQIIVLMIVAAVSFGSGWKTHSWKVDSEIKAELEHRDTTIKELTEKNEKISQEYLSVVDRINKNKVVIVKEVPVYVPVQSDAGCVVNNGSVWLWNKSTQAPGALGSPIRVDAIPRPGTQEFANEVDKDSHVKLSEVIEAGTLNNQTALTCIKRLESLQRVIRDYQEKTK